MKKIFVRSPYIISINNSSQIGSRLELYIWNKGDIPPTNPNYTFTKSIVSETQTENLYNISNAIREYISIIKPIDDNIISLEEVKNYCFAKVKRYSLNTSEEYILIDEETFVCFEGYTNFLGGVNQYDDNSFVNLFNPNLKIYKDENSVNYVNIWLEQGSYRYFTPFANVPFEVIDPALYRLEYVSNGDHTLFEIIANGEERINVEISSFNVETICEPKYTPLICAFINRFGGWSFLTFFKANQQSIETKSNSFNLMPENWNYNTFIGSNKNFNFNGTKKITCNTGWIDEGHFELIQDLMLSETILLDNIPVICKTQSSDFKTQLKDKNINYTINFEYNFNLINDLI